MCLCHPGQKRVGAVGLVEPFSIQDSAQRPKRNDSRSPPNPLSLPKLSHSTSETKSLHQILTQAQDRKIQLEEEVIAYEERMKKLNVELKKLQGFQQQSELEVRSGQGPRLPSCPGPQGLFLPHSCVLRTEPVPSANRCPPFCWALGASRRRQLSEQGRPLLAAGNKTLPHEPPRKSALPPCRGSSRVRVVSWGLPPHCALPSRCRPSTKSWRT